MAFDIDGARKAGYSDAEILSTLSTKHNFDLVGAKQAGHDDASIMQALASRETQTPLESSPTQPEQAPVESKARQFTRKVANALPTAGGVAGGVALGLPGTVFGMGVGGIPAAAAGAGIGAAGGTAAKQLILRALGDTEGVPQTSGEAAKDIGITGAKDAALTILGGKAIQGVGRVAKIALAPSTKVAGAALGAAENVAKIGVPTVPTDVPLGARQILQYAEDNAPFLKKTPKELAEIVDLQGLNEKRKVIKHILDVGKEGFGMATTRIGTQTKAVLAQLDRKFADAIDSALPAVGKARATSAAAFKKQEILKTLGSVGKKALKAGAIGAGAGLVGKAIF